MPTDSSPAAVVIGSGFGGIAAAIRLQARGYQVSLLEMRDQPGGRAYVYRQDGFTFDAGPTIVTAPFLIDELFALGGRRTEDYVRHRVRVIRFTGSFFTTDVRLTTRATRRRSLSKSNGASTRTMCPAIYVS